MTKIELRNAYIAQGYQVQEVAEWRRVSQIGNQTKYDVEVVDPNKNFYTAQVVVTDDGKPGESAEAAGKLVTEAPNFRALLGAFLRSQEQNTVFAIVTVQTYEEDLAALVDVYTTTDGKVTRVPYLVKYRSQQFVYQPIA